MNLSELVKGRVLMLDGGMGTQLQARGLQPGEIPELWNLTHPEAVQAVHAAYFAAGSDIVLTETLLMVPSKSVSAVIGAGPEPTEPPQTGCAACGKADCPYRRS